MVDWGGGGGGGRGRGEGDMWLQLWEEICGCSCVLNFPLRVVVVLDLSCRC